VFNASFAASSGSEKRPVEAGCYTHIELAKKLSKSTKVMACLAIFFTKSGSTNFYIHNMWCAQKALNIAHSRLLLPSGRFLNENERYLFNIF
jgi:hypothetical protein